eukprot:EG_transcript_550
MPGPKSPAKSAPPTGVLHDADYFAKKRYTGPKDLLGRLEELHITFRKLPQPEEGRPMPFDPKLAQALAHEHYLNHSSRDVQLMVSCILADVFRVNAPDHPFTAEQLRSIFDAWLRQFALLADPKQAGRLQVMYLLERTASVKSFIVLTDPALECDRQTEALFDLFLNKVAPAGLDGGPAGAKHMETVLASVLDESETITQELLDLLLNNLCGAPRKAKTHGYLLAKTLLEHTGSKLQATLSHVIEAALNEHFAEARKYDDLPEFAKLRQDHLRLIGRYLEMVEELPLLHEVFLGAKLRPFLEEETEDLRLLTVEAVCNVFKARPRYCRTYQRVLEVFLARCLDRSKRIRARMVAWLQDMLAADEWFRGAHARPLLAALEDREESIRRQAITAIVEVARRQPESTPRSLIRGLEQRCRQDKKVLVRKHCLQKLCQLYSDLAPRWLGHTDGAAAAVREVCRWIPGTVLAYYDDREAEMREAVLHAVHLLLAAPGRKAKEDEAAAAAGDPLLYAQALVDVFRCLGITRPVRFNYLQQVLLAKAYLRRLAADFVSHRAAQKGGDGAEPTSRSADHEFCLAQLADRTGSQRAEWQALAALKDEKIFRALARLVDDANPCPMAEALTLRDQIVAKVRAAAKVDTLVQFVQNVAGRLLLVFPVAPEHVACLVGLARDSKKDPATRAAVLGTLATVAEAQPALFAACATDFVAVVSGETDPVALQFGLRALAFAAAHLSQDAAAQQRLWKRLRAWGLEGEPAVRKLALRCVRGTQADPTAAWQDLTRALPDQLVVGQRGTPTLLGALKAVETLLLLCPDQLPATLRSRALKFVETDVLKYYTDTRDAGASWADPPYECAAWGLGLKVIVAHLQSTTDEKVIAQSVKLLFTLLKQQTQHTVASLTQAHKITAVFKAVLKLLRTAACRRAIQPTHLCLLMVANLLESNESARETMCRAVFQALIGDRLPLKYFWLLLINVLDAEKRNAATAREYVHRAVQHYRGQQRLRERAGQRVTLSDREAPLVCPEYILPDLLYHLAHYPNFDDHHPQYEPMQTCFYTFFEAVTKDADNVSFLYKLLQTMRRCNDGWQPASKNTRILCDIAFDIVHHEYGKVVTSSGKPFPGTVNLPRSLFQPVEAPEDEAVSYKPSMFRLLGKARALRAAPAPEAAAASPAKEAPAPKKKGRAEDGAGKASPPGSPLLKRRRILPGELAPSPPRGPTGPGGEEDAEEAEEGPNEPESPPPPPRRARALFSSPAKPPAEASPAGVAKRRRAG